jgi:hypothetical protein
MVRFTDSESASTVLSTTTLTELPRPQHCHKLTVTIPTPGVLRLPVAPPSPRPGQSDESMTTEAFPDFVDTRPSTTPNPLHCIEHCDETVCMFITTVPPCCCADVQGPPTPCATGPIAPAIQFDESIFDAIHNLESDACLIEIHRDDVNTLASQFDPLLTTRVLQNPAFMNAMRASFPTSFERAALNNLEGFNDLLTLYMSRTLIDTEMRCISRAQLHAELTLYISTGFAE